MVSLSPDRKAWQAAFKLRRGHLLSMTLFVMLSGAFLWLTGTITIWAYVAAGAAALGVCTFLPDKRWIGNRGRLIWLAMAYMAAVLTAALMHHLALTKLDPAAYITTARGTAYWGEGLLARQTAVYLLFPLLLLISMAIFQNAASGIDCLKLLPLLLLPSLGVALYQAFVDIRFWNHSVRTWADRVPGLGSDVNGFGITLFLLFPIALAVLVLSRSRTAKTVYGLILVLICWAVFSSGSRTAFGGIVVMILLSFQVYFSLAGKKGATGRPYVLFLVTVVVLLILAGGLFMKSRVLQDFPLARRLQHSFQLMQRDGDVRRFSSRWELGLQAVRMIKLSPLSGWGPGGFWRQVDNIRTRYGEHRGYIDNAENLYLQTAAELGLPALIIMILFFLIPITAAVRAGPGIVNPGQRFAAGMVGCTLLVMMALGLTGPHIFSPEVAWITCVLLGYLFSTGLKHDRKAVFKSRSGWAAGALLIFWAVFSVGTYSVSLGSRGYAAVQQAPWWPLKNEYGLYLPWEDWGPPYGKMVWTSKKSSIRIKMRQNGLSFTIYAHGATASPEEPLTVTLSMDGKLLDRLLFSGPGARKLDYFLPGPGNREVFFQTEVSRTFVPRKLGLGDDRRVLGVALSPIRQHGRLPGS